ncbi:MAG: hypothetical protein WCK89_11305 [bacterium]
MALENKVNNFTKELSCILSQIAYHLHPDIINYIKEQNQKDYQYFKNLFGNKISIDNYLFNGSACVFPGVKRYISGVGNKQKYNPNFNAILDDNTFPRHIWCFLVIGNVYNGPNWKATGLNEFELAHIFSHKKSELAEEKRYFNTMSNESSPFGEFTCAANVIILPKGTVRPTDKLPVIKSIFYKRYISLYGEDTLGGRKGFRHDLVPSWYNDLVWNDPYIPENWKESINGLLEYRKRRIQHIMNDV